MQLKEYEDLINNTKDKQEVINILYKVNEDVSLSDSETLQLKELMLTKQIKLTIAEN